MNKLFISFLAVILITACSGKKEKTIVKPIMVKTITVKVDSLRNYTNYLASIEPELESGLSFQVAGNVESVFVSEGQAVKKGDLLACLSAGHLNNILSSAKAGYTEAEDAFSRMEKLYKSNSLPEIKYIEVRSRLQQAKAQLKSAQKDLSDCNLYAPFDGVVNKKMIETGVNVSPGMTAFNLIKISYVNVKVSIPEKDIPQIEIGQDVDIEIPVLNKRYMGKITKKNLASNNISQTYDVKVKLSNLNYELLPGMVGNARVYTNGTRQYITIPPSAVQLLSDNKKFVWVVENSIARLKQIQTGQQTSDGIQVYSGISTTDKIVVEGFQKLSEGTAVEEQ